MPLIHALPTAEQLEWMAEQLQTKGWLVCENILPLTLAEKLVLQAEGITEDEYTLAGTGREVSHRVNSKVRSDKICWIDNDTGNISTAEIEEDEGKSAASYYLDYIEAVRVGLNRRLFLGLFDYESHFAWYQKGDFYRRHFDSFEGRKNRVLSTVYYLNKGWQNVDGGELLIYDPDVEGRILSKIAPVFNTMVIFLSERFEHEVLLTNTSRYSLTGWFRVNTSSADYPDPPA